MSPHPTSSRDSNVQAFSLIEVAIAVSILTICLVALIGLLPAGLSNFHKAMDTTTTAQIAQRILHDMEQAEFEQVIDLAGLTSGGGLDGNGQPRTHFSFRAPTVDAASQGKALRYFDDEGVEIIPSDGRTLNTTQKTNAVYTVNVRVIPRAELPAKLNGGTYMGGAVAQVTVQVARNPSNQPIAISPGSAADPNFPERNLFQKTAGVQIFTYHGLIGKNEGK